MAMRGKWYTDGKTNRQIDVNKGDVIPEGFYIGFTPRKRTSEEKQKMINKMVQTNLERYGVEHPNMLSEKQEIFKQTCLEKYGVDNPSKSEEIKQRKVEANIEHYGTEYTWQSEEVKNKIKETNLERYGVEHPMMSDKVKERLKHTFMDRYNVENYSQTKEFRKKAIKTNTEKYNVPWTCMRPEAKLGYNNNSKPNKEFAELLDKHGVLYTREFPLGYYSYDFKIGRVLIEINPSATHNVLWGPFNQEHGVEKDYHFKKSKEAEDNGYTVMHVFDWDNKEKVVKYLSRSDINVQLGVVATVSKQEANSFLDTYNLNGTHSNKSKEHINMGMYSGEELVSLMSFSKSRGSKYDYVLSRYCSKYNHIRNIPEVMFKVFIERYKPKTLLAICDRSKFNTIFYKNLGFNEISSPSPVCNWYNIKSHELFKGYAPEKFLIEKGYLPIYDCGYSYLEWSSK